MQDLIKLDYLKMETALITPRIMLRNYKQFLDVKTKPRKRFVWISRLENTVSPDKRKPALQSTENRFETA